MKNKINSFMTIFFSIFLGISIIFLIVTGFLYFHDFKYYQTATKTTATITNISYKHDYDRNSDGRVYVKYYVDNQEYEDEINYYISSMRVGDELTVYYQPEDPGQVRVKSLVLVLVFGIIGTVFFIVSVIGYSILYGKRKKKDNLIKNGRRIYADITEIKKDLTYTVNGNHPYRIYCKYTDAYNIVHLFKSGFILYNPTDLIEETVVPVYVNEKNFNKYYVDIDQVLPQKVEVH